MYDPTPVLIGSLQPWLQPYVVWLVNYARASGAPLIVISARRSPAANLEAGGALRSQHLAGLAVDLQVIGYSRDEINWEGLGEVWERMGGRWGGRFSAPDVNHFDVWPRPSIQV